MSKESHIFSTETWSRLENLVERNPRRCGRYAMRILQHSDHNPYTKLMIGWALLRWERLSEADNVLSSAQCSLPHNDIQARLFCKRLQLMLQQQQGHGPALQDDWETFIQECELHGAGREQARARCEQIAHLNLLGRHAEATMLAECSATLLQQHGKPADHARYAYVLGVAAIGIARLNTAQQQLDLAYDQYAALGYPAERARVCFERATYWLRRELLDQADHELRTSLKIYTTLELPYRIALCQRDMGVIALYEAHYAKAITQLSIAQKQFMALGRNYHAAGCDFNIGSIAYMTGMFDLAMGMYRQAQLHYETYHDQFHACVALRNQILVLDAQGHYVQALEYSQTLAQRQELIDDPLSMAELRSIRARALYSLGRYHEAQVELELAYISFLELGNQAAADECSLDRAWFFIEARQYTQAQVILEQITELHHRPTHYWRVCYGLGRVLQADAQDKEALEYYLRAIKIVSTLRKELVSEHASSQIFLMARHLYQDALDLVAEHQEITLLLKLAEQQRSLIFDQQYKIAQMGISHLQADQKEATQRLKAVLSNSHDSEALQHALNHYLDSLIRRRNHSLLASDPKQQGIEEELVLELLNQRLSRSYGSNWSVFYPLFLDNKILLLGISPHGVHMEQYNLQAEHKNLIERACQPSMRLLLYRDLEQLQQPELPAWNSLRRLADLLLPRWLHMRLNPQHHLIIIPSGILHMLPWAALRLEHTWLCEQAIIQLSPSLHHVSGLHAINTAAPALLMGCTSFDTRATALPAALESLHLASQSWKGKLHILAEQQASCAAINALNEQGSLQHYELIHIASHAQLGQVDGLLAHIKLADDDMLLDDIMQLRLHAALVVLAACEGGAGKVLAGDEILGLSRALLIAGTDAVLANLWSINDRSTLAILKPFYEAIGKGWDAATALAFAQRTLISEAYQAHDAILQSPLIWGGFTLMTCGSE